MPIFPVLIESFSNDSISAVCRGECGKTILKSQYSTSKFMSMAGSAETGVVLPLDTNQRFCLKQFGFENPRANETPNLEYRYVSDEEYLEARSLVC